MQPNSPVQVEIDGTSVPGLLLKSTSDGRSLLVTFEKDGHVSTSWLPAEVVRAVEP